jgi:hypothetical protein
MLIRGKLAVLAMLAVALAAAGTAWSFNYYRGRRTLDFYGRGAALLIRTAPQVELLELAGVDEIALPNAEILVVDGQVLQVVRRLDISQAKGLIHARTSLLADSSYVWDAEPCDYYPSAHYAVRFADISAATLAFDFHCQRVWHVEHERSVALADKVAQGWEEFLAKQAAR